MCAEFEWGLNETLEAFWVYEISQQLGRPCIWDADMGQNKQKKGSSY